MPRRLAIAGLSAVVAAGFGAVAGLVHGTPFWSTAGIFALVALGPAVAATWYLTVGRRVPEVRNPPAEQRDSIERRWWQHAASAAFVDTTALAGSALVLVALTDFRGADPVLVLVLVLTVAWVDVLARLAVLRRAEG